MTYIPLTIILAPLLIIIFVVKRIKTTRIQKWHHASVVIILFTLLLLVINSCPGNAIFCDMGVSIELLIPGFIAGLILIYTSTKFLYSKMNVFNYVNIVIRIIDFVGVALAIFLTFSVITNLIF